MGVQTGGGNLVIPVVLWGKECPKHNVSTVAVSEDLNHIITGSQEGHLCIWEFESKNNKITPRLLIYAHSGAVLSICTVVSSSGDRKQIASSSDSGEICVWDLADGRCVESKKTQYVHNNIQAYRFSLHHTKTLICNGNYPEIQVLDIYSLTVLYSLVGKLQADWISSLTLITHSRRGDDIILAISTSGTIKLWSLDVESTKSAHVYEDESKQIRCVDAHMLRCSPFNQRTVLIVCSKYWQVYDASEFSMLCNESAPAQSFWIGGDFIAIDKICLWDSTGQAYLYKLPNNANPDHSDFHKYAGIKSISQHALASLYCRLKPCDVAQMNTVIPPVLSIQANPPGSGGGHVLVRADCTGTVQWWSIERDPPVSQDDHLATVTCRCSMSLQQLWDETKPQGLLDQVHSYLDNHDVKVTCSLYIERSGRLLAGQSDGMIVIIPVLHTVRSLVLNSTKSRHMPLHKMLIGHTARINCLLYPHAIESRYSPNHLLSGSSDFSIKLWDLSLGQLIHSFSLHAGEVTQFFIPPPQCTVRIQSCICSVANDHSVSLFSLKELRSLVFASRHMFPVESVKWRPFEDFLIIACSDSTAYVWQMETGLLDRVVHGVTAVEMMKACDEASQKILVESNPTNPQISITQALRRRNLATFKNLAQQTINNLELMVEEVDITTDTADSFMNLHTHPLIVTGVRPAPGDTEVHVLLFDSEALIVQLLCEEFGLPASEVLSIHQNSFKNGLAEVGEKITDFFSMVKEKAEGLGREVLNSSRPSSADRTDSPRVPVRRGSNDSFSSRDSSSSMDGRPEGHSLEIAQIYLSMLHAWGLDRDIDLLCSQKLGLEKIEKSVSYGMLSTNGKLVLMLPISDCKNSLSETPSETPSVAPSETVSINPSTFPPKNHSISTTNSSTDLPQHKYWELSSSLTTQHLLSVISLANTLMSMKHASFMKDKHHHISRRGTTVQSSDDMSQSQIKQSWSLMASLHCVLLPDLVDTTLYKSPHLHLLANRWQDRCLEVREACQALLLAELKRIGGSGRRLVISEWAPHMPNLIEESSGMVSLADTAQPNSSNKDGPDLSLVPAVTTYTEKRKLEATAIVLLGVIGSEFGSEFDPSSTSKQNGRGSFDGFGINNSLAWHTSKALSLLLLNPASCRLSPHAAIRRAAIDLIGRGFTVWQPYIDVSAVLLGLLEICIDAERIIPNVQTGLPLTPQADACRTARHALSLIATARPATFLTCIAKEVARYNSAAQNAQSGVPVSTSVLMKAKHEILRVIELLIEKQANDVVDLLVETMDVAIHCLDANSLKTKGLQETFPALCRFAMVSYCGASRRICVGSRNGSLAFYELKQSKSQTMPFQASPTTSMILYLKASAKETVKAHKGLVAAVCFCPDGKYLASYSPVDSKVCVWHTTSSSLFSLGSQHTKCVKSYTVPWKNPGPPQPNLTKGGRLSWDDHRTISLVLPDGTESKYRI